MNDVRSIPRAFRVLGFVMLPVLITAGAVTACSSSDAASAATPGSPDADSDAGGPGVEGGEPSDGQAKSDGPSNDAAAVPPGSVDPAFSSGPRDTPLTTTAVSAADAEGRIYVGGSADQTACGKTTGQPRGALFRFNADGTNDTTFGTAGVACLDPGTGPQGITQIVVRSTATGERLLVAGNGVNNDASLTSFVAQLTTTGDIDAAFTRFTGPATTSVVSIASDAAGLVYVSLSKPSIVRLTASGAVDATWGTSGTLSTALEAIAIVPASASSVYFVDRLAITALDATGKPNSSFGNAGTSLPDPNVPAYVNRSVFDLALQGTALLISGQFGQNGVPTHAAQTRYLATGAVDDSFNGIGTEELGAITGGPHTTFVTADGKIIAAGPPLSVAVPPAPSSTSIVCRSNADGTLDPAFATAGAATVTSVPGNGFLNALDDHHGGVLLVSGTLVAPADATPAHPAGSLSQQVALTRLLQ